MMIFDYAALEAAEEKWMAADDAHEQAVLEREPEPELGNLRRECSWARGRLIALRAAEQLTRAR